MLACGQSYKASTLVHYDSRVISISNLLEITTRVVINERKMFIRLATETILWREIDDGKIIVVQTTAAEDIFNDQTRGN